MRYLAQVSIGSTFNSPFGTTSQGTIAGLVTIIIRGSFVIAGLILLFFFVFGGIQIIAGAGNNDPRAVGQGRQALTYAAVGFLIVFVAYWIVRLIELIVGGGTWITSPFLGR